MKGFFALFLCLWALVGSTTTEDLDETSTFALDTRASILSTLFNSACVEPPKVCPNENVTFWYYKRSAPENPLQLDITKEESFNSLENNEHPWKIIIHGYTKSKDEIPNPQLRSAYFKRGEYNILSVDYNPLAKDKCYIASVRNVPLIANCTAQMISALVERGFFALDELHVIGFSLGAQVAGRIVEYLNGEKPMRVTGLDPASPLFGSLTHDSISKEAGDFVDVVHTNGAFKGRLATSGHVDFYMNDGLNQPGCLGTNTSLSTCSHNRAPLYYAESINTEVPFLGVPCENSLKFGLGLCKPPENELVVMGEYTPTTARGIYYVPTAKSAPFALGKKGIY